MSTRMRVAVGILVNDQNEVLIQERPAHQPFAHYWEFPGGKIEADELPYDALCRELQEELGIRVQSASHWFEWPYDYPTRSVLLDIWQVQAYDGRVVPLEGQVIRWCPVESLSQYKFVDANEIIIEKLELAHSANI